MMPRCSSVPASIFSVPGASDERSPPKLAIVAPSHGGEDGSTWLTPLRSLSAPSMNAPGDRCSEAVGEETTLASGDAWLELQREMGTLKADNRMLLRGGGGCKGGGSRPNSHELRASRSAVGALTKHLTRKSTPPGSSAVSVLTKPPAESSTVCAGEVTDLLAKSLSLGLGSPVPAWKGGKPG